ncbi:hypothetical protein [Methylobacterium sp. Gmos1]
MWGAVSRIATIFLSIGLLTDCASTTAVPVAPGDNITPGIRVYDRKPILMVFNKGATIEFIPNYNRGYALQFTAFLAKNDVKTVYEAGGLKSLDTNLDSTEFVKLLTTIASGLIGAPGGGGSNKATSAGETSAGPLRAMYEFEFSDTGDFVRLRRLDNGFPKPFPEAPTIGPTDPGPVKGRKADDGRPERNDKP